MKKARFRKLLSIATAFVMTLGIGVSTAFAAPLVPPVPNSTNVIINKLVADSFTNVPRAHDGSVITDFTSYGTNVRIDNTGVVFRVWTLVNEPAISLTIGDGISSIEKTALDALTIAQLDGYFTGANVNAGATTALGTGTYYIRETAWPATLTQQIGVPTILELPALNTLGNAYLDTVNIYPKNVIHSDRPTVDKDVASQGNDHAGYNIGDVFSYMIYPTVPVGIQNYTKFIVTDTLETTLDYRDTLTVTYNGTPLTSALPTPDYTVTGTAVNGSAGGDVIVTFTTAGLAKLGAEVPNPLDVAHALKIQFDASINSNAVMGTDIYNNAVLTYNNGYMTDSNTEVVNKPEVHTGGRQFIKVDNATGGYLSGLANARFVVQRADLQYMIQNPTTKVVTWTTVLADATRLAPDSNGAFEVKGLKYNDDGTAVTYTMIEDVKPDAYLQMDPLDFTIDGSSYLDGTIWTDNTKVINVRQPVIPQTGGIGTLIFLVTGMTMMGGAVVALRRREELEK